VRTEDEAQQRAPSKSTPERGSATKHRATHRGASRTSFCEYLRRLQALAAAQRAGAGGKSLDGARVEIRPTCSTTCCGSAGRHYVSRIQTLLRRVETPDRCRAGAGAHRAAGQTRAAMQTCNHRACGPEIILGYAFGPFGNSHDRRMIGAEHSGAVEASSRSRDSGSVPTSTRRGHRPNLGTRSWEQRPQAACSSAARREGDAARNGAHD
jgi:hypothetical protein